MTNQKRLLNPVNSVLLLTALTELLKLKRMDMDDAEAINQQDASIAIAKEYGKLMKNATKIAFELLEDVANGELAEHGPQPLLSPVDPRQLKIKFEKDVVNKIADNSKIVHVVEKNGHKERISSLPLRRNLAEVAYTNIFKKNLGDTAEKHDLSPDDLFTDEALATPFTRVVMKSIISYLEEGKRGECVGYLVSYVFKHRGMTEVDAHRLLNGLKDHYGIIEKSKMRNAEVKRKNEQAPAIPKGTYLWAKYLTHLGKQPKLQEVEGVIIWPKNSQNNTIVNGMGEFVCLENNVLEYRLATRSEIQLEAVEPHEQKMSEVRKICKAYLEREGR